MRKAIKTFAIILICSVPLSYVPYILSSTHALCNINEELHSLDPVLYMIFIVGAVLMFISLTVLITLSIVFRKFRKAELINEKYPLALCIIAYILPAVMIIADTVYSIISMAA